MASKVIVFVAGCGDPKFGEVSVFDSSSDAERLVETLLQAGYDQKRIHVFSGAEMEARVSHRPVVALMTADQVEVGAAAAPEAPAGQKEAAPGTNGHPEAEPVPRHNGSLLGRMPAGLVEMMPELFH